MASGGRQGPRPGRRIRGAALQTTGTSQGKARGAALTIALACAIGASGIALGPGIAGAAGSSGSGNTSSPSASQSQINSTESRVTALAAQISQQQAVLEGLNAFAGGTGYAVLGQTESPILGAKGNREFFLHLRSHA